MKADERTRTRFAQVAELFRQSAGIEPAERARFLAGACGDDGDLRAQVQALLDADEAVPSYLSDDALAAGAQRRAVGALDEPVAPASIGGYSIHEVIGRGGMGVVYRAEQTDPMREVALKVIRPGVMDAGMRRRFRHEAKVLSRLDHPGIARIYEAGVDSTAGVDQSYLAMELVHGRSLTEYAQARTLDLRSRLDLVARVCDAVQHAHQRGVIHRDLKPGNVLVDEQDRPRLVDFGVARTIGADTLATTMATRPGQLVGTLPYMSPEQLGADPDDVDTRSDVYALGIVLYELMTERRPHELEDVSIYEAVRIVRERAVPKLGTLDRRFRGDVETIVARATDPDRDRRYQSAAELAGDIRLHLEGRPITARRDATLYVAMKHARRHAKSLTVAFVVLALVIVFAVLRVRDQAHVAELDAIRLLMADGRVADPFSSDLPPRHQLDVAATWLDGGRGGSPGARADVHAIVGHGYLKHGLFEDAQRHFAEGLALRESVTTIPDADLASALHDHGRALFFLSDFDGAEDRYRAALAMREDLQGRKLDADAAATLASAVADSTNDIGACLKRKGLLVAAETWYRAALGQRRALDLERWIAASLNNLATCLRDQQLWEEAEAHFREALALIESFDDVNPLFIARGRRSVANCCIHQGKLDEAATLLAAARETTLANAGRRHPDAIRCDHLEARLAFARGWLDEAERRTLDVRAAYADVGDHPLFEVVSVLTLLGDVRAAGGRPADAIAAYDEAIMLSEDAYGPKHATTMELLATRARIEQLQKEAP
ncbi:MAG: serine/threonine protein kinase [Planctomycetes bacterium]|nr:serine/threonine protein kinase [Planctomycetota bacterium]